MRSSMARYGLVLVLLIVQAASAARSKTEVTLMWEDDATPTRFLLTVTTSGSAPQQFQVAPSAPGACAQLPTATPHSFCTMVACPAKGTVTAYVVQADFGGTLSTPSNTVTTSPPPTLPVLTTTPPPLPQQTAAGLNLQPMGRLPQVPSAPPIPATGAG